MDGDLDPRAVRQLVTVLSSAKKNTRFNSRFITSLKNLKSSDSDGLKKVLEQLSKESKEAIEAIIDKSVIPMSDALEEGLGEIADAAGTDAGGES